MSPCRHAKRLKRERKLYSISKRASDKFIVQMMDDEEKIGDIGVSRAHENINNIDNIQVLDAPEMLEMSMMLVFLVFLVSIIQNLGYA